MRLAKPHRNAGLNQLQPDRPARLQGNRGGTQNQGQMAAELLLDQQLTARAEAGLVSAEEGRDFEKVGYILRTRFAPPTSHHRKLRPLSRGSQ